MTYREYLSKCSFDEIWEVIRAAYDEPVEIKPLYRRLYDSIISFPKLNTEEIMVVYTDSFSEPASIRSNTTKDATGTDLAS